MSHSGRKSGALWAVQVVVSVSFLGEMLPAQSIGDALAGLVVALWPSTMWLRRDAGSPASLADVDPSEPGESGDAPLCVTCRTWPPAG